MRSAGAFVTRFFTAGIATALQGRLRRHVARPHRTPTRRIRLVAAEGRAALQADGGGIVIAEVSVCTLLCSADL